MDSEAPGTVMADELSRLTALYGSGILDDGPQQALDALVQLAASLLACPTAMLTLLDRETLHVCASTAEPIAPVPRGITLCDHAIRVPDGMVVRDLQADPRFADNPFVIDGLRFYAGVPITAPDAAGLPRPIGALCVVDAVPRDLDDRGRQALHHLARLADVLIAARTHAQCAIGIAVEHERLVADRARQHRVFAQAERMTGIGSWRLSLPDEHIEWSEGVYRIYGLPPGPTPDLQTAMDPYPIEARARVAAALAAAIEHCTPFDFEEDFRSATGELRRVRSIGECEQVDGTNVALVGVFQDVTDRHHREIALRHDADTDALTGLANRAAFDKALTAAMLARAADAPLLLALIDLDGFKAINDTLGHTAGDDVLRGVSAALRALAAALPDVSALTARIGGDEFALLIEGDAIDPAALAEMLEQALLVSARAGDLTLACSGSVGIAVLGDETSPRDFIRRADGALYAAKRARIGDRRRADRRAA
ncbi:diguanylate cyclase domain-containing protein [Sphingomonas bacterium]|uniref:diguanylate cyclase domain-containing protein n=1 Tax=Sphingomonas bacterium TaxID=1895847 RepID=UPI00157678D0|nr:diguanylate cyclase [Sphingomonas bacterium]